MLMFSPLCHPGSHGSGKKPKGAKEAKEAQGAQKRIRDAETTETHGDMDGRGSGGRTSGGRREVNHKHYVGLPCATRNTKT